MPTLTEGSDRPWQALLVKLQVREVWVYPATRANQIPPLAVGMTGIERLAANRFDGLCFLCADTKLRFEGLPGFFGDWRCGVGEGFFEL